MKKLKEMYLMLDYKGSKKNVLSSRPPKNWEEQEMAQLRELFEQFKDGIGKTKIRAT